MSASQENPSHLKYRPDIDGLRAIAVLSVVGFHAFGVMGGYTGVDIFFVISGYLISTIIFEGLEKQSFSFNQFYQRRIRRIFPSLLLVLIACLFFGWFSLFADEYEQLGKHIVAGSTFISNLVLWSESSYFDIAAEKKPLLHLWSLGIEEQFYFFWPIFCWLFWKFRAHYLWIVLAITIFSFGLNAWLIDIDGVATFYSPITRFWELLVGAFLAYVVLFNPESLERVKRFNNTFSILGLVLIIVSISVFTKDLAFPGWWAALPVLGVFLLIMAGPDTWVSKKILSNKVLVWFGLISFPLYLWHWPLLTFVRLLSDSPRYLIIGSIISSIFLAWLSYRYVEKPIRYGKNPTQKSIYLIVAMLVVGISGLIIYQKAGLEFRIDDGQEGRLTQEYRMQLAWPDKYNYSDACRAKYGADQYCLISDISRAPNAALIGDSHANHFYPGLEKYFLSKGENLILLGAGACPPFLGIDRLAKTSKQNFNCYVRTEKLYEFVLNDQNIKTVLIAFYHNLTFDNNFIFEDKIGNINTTNNYQASLDSLVRTIDALEKRGKKVILIYDMPNINADIRECALVRPGILKKSKCDLKQIKLVNDFEVYDKMIAELQKLTHVEIFDTRPYLAENFPVDFDGNLNYRDSTHLSYRGSLFFSDKYRF